MTRQGHGRNGPWPLQDFLELGVLVSAVPCARLHVRQVLWEWGLASHGESTELLVSELVTNAVRAAQAVAQASSVRLWLLSDRAKVLILVWDASPRPPVRVDASGAAENGRGLMLAAAMRRLILQGTWPGSAAGSGRVRR
jgi:anti-sigma regulatory factor (Ser/Thr protein kinase)